MGRPFDGAIGILSDGILGIRNLEALLGENVVRVSFARRTADGLTGVAAWGRRPTARKAQEFARTRGVTRMLCLEDGFLRSVYPGASSQTCSLVVDDLGIYYDATMPSRLEAMIAMPISAHEDARAGQLIEQWRAAGVSKYNYAPEPARLPDAPYVLVVDQTENDASVQYGLADADSFRKMLDAAIRLYPACRVVVKEHPLVKLGRKRGYVGRLLDRCEYPDVLRLQDDVHAVALLQQATAVFVVTSQVGFEALLHGKPVHTFGMPFYAGWGLTQDALQAPARRNRVSLTQLAFSALVRYTRYVSPHTGLRCEAEDAIDHLALQRRMRQQIPAHVHAIGFSRWKRPILRRFLQGHTVHFHRRERTIPAQATVLRWGRTQLPYPRAGWSVITVEDGFLRSVGLGAQLVRPVSWVFDAVGIYYDATQPSALERLLAETQFEPSMLARAARLRETIVRTGITKYNVGGGAWQRPAHAKEVVLVVGQVESDASLRYGAPGIRTNRALLEAVRREAPHACIVYKPHPDVMAGLRGSRDAELELGVLCDELVPDYPMHQLIEAVDRVHVLTSLAGFEALLRGKPVTTHGMPFYAGWGLTDDRCGNPRRQRTLTLEALVAGALILYPRYVSRDAGAGFASPEQVIADLLAWKREHPGTRERLLRWFMQPLMRRWANPAARVPASPGARLTGDYRETRTRQLQHAFEASMMSSLNGEPASYGTESAVGPLPGGSVASERQRASEGAPLERLASHRRVLLLQGPNGPFFARLRDYLSGRGSHVVKVNFNGGDELFYRSGDIVRFTEPMVFWEATLRQLLVDRRIEAIVVFGSSRRHHRIAARVAQSIGMPFWVFEEGYVRPDYITLEEGGVNAESPLSAVAMADLPATTLPAKPRRFAHAFRNMALYSFWYFVGGMLGTRRYPAYRHHKPFGLHELALWTRAWYRKYSYRWQERGVRQRLLNSDHPHFFMVALQVHNDSQIRVHSPWRRMDEFIEWTIQSFSVDAPADSVLVVKHHPLDRGHTNYAAVVAASAARFGVTGRVVYIHDAHLPSLLHRCLGLVTINSTSGLQALFHRVPVIALGRCFYAKRGLTFQGSLGAFWNNPGAVDMSVFTRFRNYLVRNSQINESFYSDDALLPAYENKRWRLAASIPARIVCMTMLILADAYSGHPWDIATTIDFVAGLVVG